MIYLLLFSEFFKVGLFCFGGAFGMIPLIEEIVLSHGWLTEGQFYDFLGICESTPGPIAVNLATYIGSVQGGLMGSILATLGVVLPSFIIILLVSSVMKGLTDNKYFKGFIKGVKPVIAALIISTGFIILAKAIFKSNEFDFASALIFLLLYLINLLSKKVCKKKISAVWLIVISAVLGILASVI